MEGKNIRITFSKEIFPADWRDEAKSCENCIVRPCCNESCDKLKEEKKDESTVKIEPISNWTLKI